MMSRLPALFLGHGNPMNVLDPSNRFNVGIRTVGANLPKPKAILMISAHWYSPALQVSSAQQPEMIYDFYGFPPELSQVRYDASGSPELAQQITELLVEDGIIANDTRGFDHGTWAVLKYLFPKADVPVVQLSLKRGQSTAWHIRLAQKLSVLREQGVLVVGSGNIVHNLREMSSRAQGYDWATSFRHTINQAIVQRDLDTLVNYANVPYAELAVPTEEHYLPLLYIMAMAKDDDSVELFNDEMDMGAVSMTSVVIGA